MAVLVQRREQPQEEPQTLALAEGSSRQVVDIEGGKRWVDVGTDTAEKAEHVWLGQVSAVMVSRQMLGWGVMGVSSVSNPLDRFVQQSGRGLAGGRAIVVAAGVD